MSGGFLNQFSPLLCSPPSVSPHGFKGWVTGLPAIVLPTTESPYSTVTKQGAQSRLFLLTSLLCSTIPSAPFILSQFESRKVGEKYLQANGLFSDENTFRNLSATFFKKFSTEIQTFWSGFILKYQNTKTTTMLNGFCECVIQQPTISAFYSASYCLFVLHSSFSTFNDTSTVQKQQNVSLLTQYFPTCFVFPCLKTCWQTSFRFKHLAVSLCCSAESWCSHFFLQGLEGPTVSMVSFEPTLPPVVSSGETQWWCPWLLCRPLYLWPEASWNGFGSH